MKYAALAVLAALCAIALVGCGGGSNAGIPAPAGNSTVVTTPTTVFTPAIRAWVRDNSVSWERYYTQDLPLIDGVPTAETGTKLVSCFEAYASRDEYPPDRRIETTVYNRAGETVPIVRYPAEAYEYGGSWAAPQPGTYSVRLRRVVDDVVVDDKTMTLNVIEPVAPTLRVVVSCIEDTEANARMLWTMSEEQNKYGAITWADLRFDMAVVVSHRGGGTVPVFTVKKDGAPYTPIAVSLPGGSGFRFYQPGTYVIEGTLGDQRAQPATLVVADGL